MWHLLTWWQWVVLALPLLVIIPLLLLDPFGGRWRHYQKALWLLLAFSIGGSLLIGLVDGSRSIASAIYWWFGRVSLLLAAVSVVSGLHFKTGLKLTPKVLAILVVVGFTLGLVVDPLLVMVLILYQILRGRGPVTAAVAVTLSATLSGAFSLSNSGAFGAVAKAALKSAGYAALLWESWQVWLVCGLVVFYLALHTYLWASMEWIDAPDTSRRWRTVWRSAPRFNRLVFLSLFGALVAAQWLPDTQDGTMQALTLALSGESISARWEELLPWREFANLIIGAAAYLLVRPAQKTNRLKSYKPVREAAWVMFLMHLSVAPLLTVVHVHSGEWMTLASLMYELLREFQASLRLWQLRLLWLLVAFVLVIAPNFVMIRLAANHKGLRYAKLRGNGRDARRLTPAVYVWWALRLSGFPLLGLSIFVYLSERQLESWVEWLLSML